MRSFGKCYEEKKKVKIYIILFDAFIGTVPRKTKTEVKKLTRKYSTLFHVLIV